MNVGLLDEAWVEAALGRRWLVGVSGGRDSVVLLDSLLEAGVRDLVVVHVDHGLRGEASEGDAEFVRELAEENGLDFLLERADVGGLAVEAGKGVELMAREVRHGVFARGVVEFGCSGVVLGHHADDQAETVLFNLLRGGDGLRGMRLVSELEVDDVRFEVCRPLLGIRRLDIDDWVEARGLAYREDASNAEGFTARNRLRNEVMPLLREVMGREVSGVIVAAFEGSLGREEFLDTLVDYAGLLDPQGRLYLPAFADLAGVLQGRVMYRYLREAGVPDISREVVGRCLGLLRGEVAKVNLPGGGWMRRREKRLFVESPGL